MMNICRRRSSCVRVLILIPAAWLFALLVFTAGGSVRTVDNQQQPAAAPLDERGDDKNQLKPQHSNSIQGFGPPIQTDIEESLGGNAKAMREKPSANPSEDKTPPIVPIDAKTKRLLDPSAIIYKPGGEANMAGELGKAVNVNKNELTAEQKKEYDDGFTNNAFNQYASDMISIHRTLPTSIDQECVTEPYPVSELPDTSVIICFHNEAWSVLLRTVHSVLDRTPVHLLKEIILVDDFSDKEHTKAPLETYFAKFPKVQILRLERREGLIRARLKGADVAKGKVLTFLDSHCECMDGWLPPLLTRIHKDPTTVVCPVIDVIDDNTFEYHYSKAYFTNVGGFDWSLQFNWHAIPERDRKNRSRAIDPVASPTMAGGLFSIDAAFFTKLGTYDPGFDIWGGENLELSFKTWMCGGRLEIIPCSHVGHIFRKRSPYKWRTGVNVLKRNSVRLAEVWLDDYKKYYYERINWQLGDMGDIEDRKKLRADLGCKSFKWYLDNIYPELFVPGDAVAKGELRSMAPLQGLLRQAQCLDSPATEESHGKAITPYPCHDQGGNQYWMFSKDGEIRRDESCIDYAGQDVMIYPCHGMKGNQEWQYIHQQNRLRHKITGKCLEMTKDGAQLKMQPCDNSDYQKWKFKEYDEQKAREHGMFI